MYVYMYFQVENIITMLFRSEDLEDESSLEWLYTMYICTWKSSSSVCFDFKWHSAL